jgi:hypothetical protein
VLRVPPAVPLRVRLVDAETRAILDEDHIFWSATSPAGRLPVPSQGTYRAEEADHFELRVPRGWIRIGAHAEGFVWKDHLVQVEEGMPELTLALEPVCRVRVTLRDGERTLPFPERIGPRAFTPDGEEVACGRSWYGDEITLNLEQPGTYLVRVPAVDGYAAPEPMTVEARRREVVDATFQLVRSR